MAEKIEKKREAIDEVVKHIEQEARMVLPGIQALFGFQLIAIFNQRFEKLSITQQREHLAALFFSAISVLFVLAPAAYHRIAEPREVSEYLCRFGSFCLSVALLPLALGISIDLFIITHFVGGSEGIALACAAVIFTLYIFLWFIFPRLLKLSRKHMRKNPLNARMARP